MTSGSALDPPKPSNSVLPRLNDQPTDFLLRRDVFGRNILHLCVLSNNTQRLAEILQLATLKPLLAATDFESGWNVFHYAFFLKRMACLRLLLAHFSGQPPNALQELLKRRDRCGRDPLSLLENGASNLVWFPAYINENDDFHLIRRTAHNLPRPSSWWSPEFGASAAYAYGSNTYGNLGLGAAVERAPPTKVCMSRDPGRLRAVHVANYHAAVVARSGAVLTCGSAKRGRLGLGNSSNSPGYVEVPGLYAVRGLSISSSHNLAVTSTGRVFSWGSNMYGQLGFESNMSVFGKRNEIYEATPHEVRFFRNKTDLKGVAVSNVHSLVYTAESIFFWGLNVGQMGFPASEPEDFVVGHVMHSGSVQRVPTSVDIRERVRQVATSETCTVVVTETNELIVCFQNQRAKLPRISPRIDTSLHFELFKPSVMTRAPVISKVCVQSPELIHVLVDSGDIVQVLLNTASPKNSTFHTVWTPETISMQAVDMDTAADGSIVLCTLEGAVFRVCIQARGSSGIPKRKYTKVDGINRVVQVACSDSFSSFGFLRDEVDPLPYKLQQNDFLKDMEYLSPLVEPDRYRKQDQLLDVDHHTNCYICPQFGSADAYMQDTAQNPVLAERLQQDRLVQAYVERHTTSPKHLSTYQQFSAQELEAHKQMLRSCIECDGFQLDWSQEKFCDGAILSSGIRLGIHKGLFLQRSAFCRRIFAGSDEYFLDQHIRGHFAEGTIHFDTPVEPIAVLVFVHFMYTNTVLDFWSKELKSEKEQAIRRDFRALMTLFQMSYESDAVFLSQMAQLGESYGDVVLDLADGESIQCSSFVICRCAFFETILAWDDSETESNSKSISMENVTLAQMKVILRHLQGCNDMAVFEPETERICEPDEFVNFVLDMMDVADELLLVQLKRLCEYTVQDYLSLENVLILLSHSDGLNAPRLFMSCCWYLYHNLELVVFDANFKDIDENVWRRVEKVLDFLDNCKNADFVIGDKGELDWSVARKAPEPEMVETFLSDFANFNEMYMSDRKGFSSFEPIFEVSEQSSRRKSSRKMSKSEQRVSGRSVSSDRRFSMSEMRDDLRNVASECAVDDDDFEVVTRRKRDEFRDKDGDSGRSGAREIGPNEKRPNEERNGKQTDKNENKTVDERAKEKPKVGKGPLFTPALGENVTVEKRSKIKFSPAMKKSQKERKAQTAGPVVPEKVTLRNPWAKADESGPKTTGKSSELKAFPVLGQAASAAPKSVKKLSTVMLEEASRAAETPHPVKTLQEIQQEQEFARWWEEECRRVQMEEESLSRLARGEPARGGRGRGRGRRGRR